TRVAAASLAAGDFITAVILNIDIDEFELINDLIDGTAETASSTTGKLRFKPGTTDSTFYLALPFKS
ncbi:MAG: hypothetical protein ACT4O1_16775, partial [Gemmatimonadota bacterium]